ncbi:MAG: glycosyl hydrolase 115 family protein, partial [Spirochaeta sp.]
GTSHHEPLMRAWKEWPRYGRGEWNMDRNAAFLEEYWEQSVRRSSDVEGIYTVGMRGDGDEPLTEENYSEKVQSIIARQRKILARVFEQPPEEIPQLWAVYKEVQDVYEQGIDLPDDILVMLCDDNWGNLRKLPPDWDSNRSGGFGLYYHFDYVGGPRNYKWVNSSPLPRVWEQLTLAYRSGIDRLWIVNVGDIKPLEFPLQFFLDFAWNPEGIAEDQLQEYTRLWADQQFGKECAADIAELITLYTTWNGRCKPELLSPETYSLVHYQEAERVLSEVQGAMIKLEACRQKLPESALDAYYQLVEYPVKATGNLLEMYISAGYNRLYASQERASANAYAERVEELFARDAELSQWYNHDISGGKWQHMMDQTHIGYTGWQQPEVNQMPEVTRLSLPSSAHMALAVEGSTRTWSGEGSGSASAERAELPELVRCAPASRFIELFNRGSEPFVYGIADLPDWVIASAPEGTVEQQKRIFFTVDWNAAPQGRSSIEIPIHGPQNQSVTVGLTAVNESIEAQKTPDAFIETDGYISIEADHYSRRRDAEHGSWLRLPGHGKTGSAMTILPQNTVTAFPVDNLPGLSYDCWTFGSGLYQLTVYISPTNDLGDGTGMRMLVSVDDDDPVEMNFHLPDNWDQAVANNIRTATSRHTLSEPGKHVIHCRLCHPGIVVQKLVLHADDLPSTCLGPPESRRGLDTCG